MLKPQLVESSTLAETRSRDKRAHAKLNGSCIYTVAMDCKLCSACTAGISSSGATTSVFVATTKQLCSDA
eukprot:5309-Heterococcus_DN1.PRE.1